MQTLLAGAQALTSSPTQEGEDAADPYLTVLTYFNALRELGGARLLEFCTVSPTGAGVDPGLGGALVVGFSTMSDM
ncbi:MAG: hypothetical protein E5V94_04705 [Mesorhizobium sp.]|nr:MAG: hypothetical protein E5V94_04705 [Mesorhizobium sp.]TIX02658.1 MAG: hypothetical protein E5V59_00260 [Mesorhizobium sp.]